MLSTMERQGFGNGFLLLMDGLDLFMGGNEMVSARESLIVVLRCVRTRKTQRIVEDRVKHGKCLGVVDGKRCDGKASKLGLCQSCHNKFSYQLKLKSKEDQNKYRQRLIQDGTLLNNDGEARRLKKDASYWSRMA